jgi:hypothetical protein
MFIFMVILTELSLWAVIASVVSVTRDGYRRVPTQSDAPYARESDRKAPRQQGRVLHG